MGSECFLGLFLGLFFFFILKFFVDILNALLLFYFSLNNFTFSPSPLMSEVPLFPPKLLGQQVGVAEGEQCSLLFAEALLQPVITGLVCL